MCTVQAVVADWSGWFTTAQVQLQPKLLPDLPNTFYLYWRHSQLLNNYQSLLLTLLTRPLINLYELTYIWYIITTYVFGIIWENFSDNPHIAINLTIGSTKIIRTICFGDGKSQHLETVPSALYLVEVHRFYILIN